MTGVQTCALPIWLCLIQTPTSGAERVVIKTEILHGRTGHLFSFGELSFKSEGLNLQQIGSGITYTKRFAISTILGVAGEDEDTDGNSALPTPAASQPKAHRPFTRPGDQPATQQPAAPEQPGWWEAMGITATHSIAAARVILKRKGWLTDGQGLADLPADKVQQLSARAEVVLIKYPLFNSFKCKIHRIKIFSNVVKY